VFVESEGNWSMSFRRQHTIALRFILKLNPLFWWKTTKEKASIRALQSGGTAGRYGL
jgi:hypothetical protein